MRDNAHSSRGWFCSSDRLVISACVPGIVQRKSLRFHRDRQQVFVLGEPCGGQQLRGFGGIGRDRQRDAAGQRADRGLAVRLVQADARQQQADPWAPRAAVETGGIDLHRHAPVRRRCAAGGRGGRSLHRLPATPDRDRRSGPACRGRAACAGGASADRAAPAAAAASAAIAPAGAGCLRWPSAPGRRASAVAGAAAAARAAAASRRQPRQQHDDAAAQNQPRPRHAGQRTRRCRGAASVASRQGRRERQLAVTRFCAAIAFASTSACCNWKSVSSGFAGSNFGKPSGGLSGISLAIGGRSVRGGGGVRPACRPGSSARG